MRLRVAISFSKLSSSLSKLWESSGRRDKRSPLKRPHLISLQNRKAFSSRLSLVRLCSSLPKQANSNIGRFLPVKRNMQPSRITHQQQDEQGLFF